MTTDTVTAAAVVIWIALLFAGFQVITRPPKWWIRRQARLRREKALREYREAMDHLSDAFTELGTQLATVFTPTIKAVATIFENYAKALEEANRGK